MKFFIKALLVIFMLTVFPLSLCADEQPPKEPPLTPKELMGENYEVMQRLLVSLLKDSYATMSKDLDIIIDHASLISQYRLNVSEDLLVQFRFYALNLKVRANNLKTISKTVQQRTQDTQDIGVIGVPKMEYLRDVSAAHFGEIVAMCVHCHNQFRLPPNP